MTRETFERQRGGMAGRGEEGKGAFREECNRLCACRVSLNLTRGSQHAKQYAKQHAKQHVRRWPLSACRYYKPKA